MVLLVLVMRIFLKFSSVRLVRRHIMGGIISHNEEIVFVICFYYFFKLFAICRRNNYRHERFLFSRRDDYCGIIRKYIGANSARKCRIQKKTCDSSIGIRYKKAWR